MSTQTEAQRLITEWHDAWIKPISPTKYARAGGKMAEELRRLEAANAELVKALKAFVAQIEWGAKISGTEGYLGKCADKARAAIAKHGGVA